MEIEDNLKIKVVSAKSKTMLRINLDRTALLSGIEELRLTGDTTNLETGKHVVDLSKAADLLSRLPSLRRLSFQGSTGVFCTAKAGDSVFGNLTELDLASCSLTLPSLRDIISSCSAKLKRFRFSCASERDNSNHAGTAIVGADIIQMLDMAGLSGSLHSLEIDTSHSETFTNSWDWPISRGDLRTVPSLGHFVSLRHLSISADSIYFPSMSPGVLLRDDHSGPLRLVQFLPSELETLEITGISAIHFDDVLALAQACEERRALRALRQVVLKAGGVLGPHSRALYQGADEGVDPEQVMGRLRYTGSVDNAVLAEWFAATGVDYRFEQPELFTTVYYDTWDST